MAERGRETKHRQCPGCGMKDMWQEASPLPGLCYCITRCCAGIKRPEGTAASPGYCHKVPLAALMLSLRSSSPPEQPLSPGGMLSQPALQTPPLLGTLASSRRTTTCCLSWASSPSPVGQWCAVSVAEHRRKSVTRNPSQLYRALEQTYAAPTLPEGQEAQLWPALAQTDIRTGNFW